MAAVSSGVYTAATDNLRSATMWLLTAAAAAGAVITAGVQLTSIGSLGAGNWPRLAVAAGGLIAALGAIGYTIFRTSMLLTDEWITLAQLELDDFKQQLRDSGHRRDKRRVEAIDRIYRELDSYQDELYGGIAYSISDLYNRLVKANDLARRAPSRRNAQAAADLKAVADRLVQAANYSYTRSQFAVLRRRLAQAGAVFVTGIVLFAYAANPPKPAIPAGNAARPDRTAVSPAATPRPPAVRG